MFRWSKHDDLRFVGWVACPRLCMGMMRHSNVTGPCPPQAVGMPPFSLSKCKIVRDARHFRTDSWCVLTHPPDWSIAFKFPRSSMRDLRAEQGGRKLHRLGFAFGLCRNTRLGGMPTALRGHDETFERHWPMPTPSCGHATLFVIQMQNRTRCTALPYGFLVHPDAPYGRRDSAYVSSFVNA